MSAGTARIRISRFSCETEEKKQVLQETVIFCVLEIKWPAANDKPFSKSKTTCSISATSWRFKAHKMGYMGQQVWLYFFSHVETDSS